MDGLLFLAHRIPYPPNKGDKIRSFHILNHFSKHYRIYLGAFVDDPADYHYEEKLREYCENVCLVRISRRWQKLWSLRALFADRALSLTYFSDKRMQSWVDEVLRGGEIRKALVFSSAMAQYLVGRVPRATRAEMKIIMDFVDVDSDKWRMYGESRRWPVNWVFRREAQQLLRYDREVAAAVDASVFISKEEVDLFRRLAPDIIKPIVAVGNGVDTEYFSPFREYDSPYAGDDKVLVFTGAMDYWANVDAVCWFAREIFPSVREQVPKARFFIVGARPTDAVRRLSSVEGVCVTGAVNDVRAYLRHAVAAVAPMRIARGVQNKVLEAMAMARPVVMTSAAIQGLCIPDTLRVFVNDDKRRLTDHSIRLLSTDAGVRVGKLSREFVEKYCSWPEKMVTFSSLLGDKQPNQYSGTRPELSPNALNGGGIGGATR